VRDEEPPKIIVTDVKPLKENGSFDSSSVNAPKVYTERTVKTQVLPRYTPQESTFAEPVTIYIRVDDKKCDAFKKAYLLVEIFDEGQTKVCFFDKSTSKYESLSGVMFKATEYTVKQLKLICGEENVVCK